ncbi:LysR family transcriptional regulator [Alginatibacterium sediminis]|uniref:LysR family transcriptional regulator n=1 Tax=Alginatibacterium sediminis TaxID=2164068 RepID=A0A420EIH2_9ALTE|nr:LysR family transcriptional regulator [Alginatibacterium sediminis]RKF20366.1 LysR family transcriptional regulator [Alginatibacterium sediminis]
MSNEIPNLNLLAVFAAVMEQGSLSKAAEHLATNQSTISTALSRLKKETGKELFVRSGRGVVPTAYASNLFTQIQPSVQQLSQVFHSLKDFDPGRSTRKFVMTAPEHLQWLLLNHFENKGNKNISLEVFDQADDDETLYHGLLTQKFDVMVDILPPNHPNIESIHLFDGEFVIACRQGHPRIKGALSEAQYMSETHAVLERTRDKMRSLAHYTDIDTSKRKVAYHGKSLFNNLLMCSQSDFITVVPLSMALQFEKQLQLQVFKPPFNYKKVSNYLIWLKQLNHDPSHRWFRTELVEAAKRIETQMLNAL